MIDPEEIIAFNAEHDVARDIKDAAWEHGQPWGVIWGEFDDMFAGSTPQSVLNEGIMQYLPDGFSFGDQEK